VCLQCLAVLILCLQCSSVLSCGFVVTRLQVLLVRIPPGAWMSLSCESLVLSCRISASGWSLVQMSRTEGGASECDREASTMRRPCPTRRCRVIKKICNFDVETKFITSYKIPVNLIQSNPHTGLFKTIVGVLTTCHTQYTWDSSICIFYWIEQHSKFLLHTLQVLYMCTLSDSTNTNTIIEFVPNCL